MPEIQRTSTSVAAFIGWSPVAPSDEVMLVRTWADYEGAFGGFDTRGLLAYAVAHFFQNGGTEAYICRVSPPAVGEGDDRPGEVPVGTDAISIDDITRRLDGLDLFNLLVVPGLTDRDKAIRLAEYCRRRRALLLLDADLSTSGDDLASAQTPYWPAESSGSYAAVYYPRVLAPDPAVPRMIRAFPATGAIAGIYARTDLARGVWKAPAGSEAAIRGVSGLEHRLGASEVDQLALRGINALRSFSSGAQPVIWGARTAEPDNAEWKYVPVRRLALHIEESVIRGLKWAALELNKEPLWAAIRNSVDAFLHGLFRAGAFQGSSPRDAYFVRCDSSTMTQADIDRGLVSILIGFAPLKPGEFVILRIEQAAAVTDYAPQHPARGEPAGVHDPYDNFRFRVKLDGRVVAGIGKVGGLNHPSVKWRQSTGSILRKLRYVANTTLYKPIVLENGVTHDLLFEQWAKQQSSALRGRNYVGRQRQTLTIEEYDAAGRCRSTYTVHHAYVSACQMLQNLDADPTTVAIQHLTVQHQGWRKG